MKRFFLCTFLFYIQFFILVNCNVEYDAPQEIKLYHTIGSSPAADWLENGIVTLQNINTGNVLISQFSLPTNFLKKVEETSEKDGLYRMKSVVRTSKGKEIPFFSFFKAKSFVEAGHTLSIVVSLDPNGSVIGVKAYPEQKKSMYSNNATVTFKVVEPGPIPDTASYILKLEREREAKERGATQDNRSFLAKYWMYLVPVVLFAVLSGTTGDTGSGAAAR